MLYNIKNFSKKNYKKVLYIKINVLLLHHQNVFFENIDTKAS